MSDGSVDLVGGNVLGATSPDLGGRFVDLGGSTTDPGFFQTNMPITFQANVSYTFSVRYLSTAAYLSAADVSVNTARATIGSINFDLTTTSSTFQTFTRTFSFPVATSVPLPFQDLGPADNSGVGIDMVMINPTAGVPEPTALALLAGALVLGAGYSVVRRRIGQASFAC